MVQEAISPVLTVLCCHSGNQLPSPRVNYMSLVNQHWGISKGWRSCLLWCSEECRSAKRGKARQHIVILREVFALFPCKKWAAALKALDIVLGSRWETSHCLRWGSAKLLSWCCASWPSFSSRQLDLSHDLTNVLIWITHLTSKSTLH